MTSMTVSMLAVRMIMRVKRTYCTVLVGGGDGLVERLGTAVGAVCVGLSLGFGGKVEVCARGEGLHARH